MRATHMGGACNPTRVLQTLEEQLQSCDLALPGNHRQVDRRTGWRTTVFATGQLQSISSSLNPYSCHHLGVVLVPQNLYRHGNIENGDGGGRDLFLCPFLIFLLLLHTCPPLSDSLLAWPLHAHECPSCWLCCVASPRPCPCAPQAPPLACTACV